MTDRMAWLMLRALRWAAWLAVVGYYTYFAMTRADHLTPFGHLQRETEFWMFFLPLAAIFIGCMEVMMRDRANLPPPALGRGWR